MKYVTRNGGATVTVFVPWDCNNNCPFCINKAEYTNKDNFNIEEVKRSIKLMSVLTPECDFVFTGGEPLAEPAILNDLLEEVHQKNTSHKVFINTSLPADTSNEIIPLYSFLNSWKKRGLITGVNVSRHLRKYVQECSDEIFEKLAFEVRINCVITDIEFYKGREIVIEKVKAFVERFKNITKYIQFRADYVTTTSKNLYVEYLEDDPKVSNDNIFSVLATAFTFKGVMGAYRMRVGYDFDADGYLIRYHRTLPYSKIYLADDSYALYDIIIKQNGDIKEDWDTCVDKTVMGNRECDNIALEIDLTAYRKVKYEDYI